MPKAIITIEHTPGQGITMQGEGNFTPGDNSLVERLSLAAIAAMDLIMKEEEAKGGYSPPFVAGDDRTIDKSVYRDSYRIDKPHPPMDDSPLNDYWR